MKDKLHSIHEAEIDDIRLKQQMQLQSMEDEIIRL